MAGIRHAGRQAGFEVRYAIGVCWVRAGKRGYRAEGVGCGWGWGGYRFRDNNDGEEACVLPAMEDFCRPAFDFRILIFYCFSVCGRSLHSLPLKSNSA